MVPGMWLMPRGRARAESFWNSATLTATAVVGSIAWVIGMGLAMFIAGYRQTARARDIANAGGSIIQRVTCPSDWVAAAIPPE